ncbi:MAG: 4Fe-4S binding protein [Nitrospirae bacterium]|nr:4Fe-4S binding protein [Nitrospirota bacterium]
MQILVNRDKCTGCQSCLSSCPYDAIIMKDDKAFINEYCQFCKTCISVCPEGAILEKNDTVTESAAETIAAKLDSHRGVIVFAEHTDGHIAHVTLELLGIGRKLADDLGVYLGAALFGASKDEASELIKWGADKVFHCPDQSLNDFNDLPYADVLSVIIKQYKPEIVLAGATAIGRSFLPRAAVRLKAGLTADCTKLQIDEGSRNLLAIRPAFGGNIMASILCPKTRPQMATVRPRVMKPGTYNPQKTGEIIEIKMPVDTSNRRQSTRVIGVEKGSLESNVNIAEAEIIVSGGRGIGSAKGFEMLHELAVLLKGTVGASRAAVDEGWIAYSHQVGQTGKTVCPKIYISCGISGAVQHVVGMQSSDIIIAINKHAEAPIFNTANFGIVADVFEIIPLLIKKIKEELK